MSYSDVEAALRNLALGGFRFLESTGSTNDDALAWAASGARDLSLVVADAQVKGRGREGRKWFTPPQAGLAFSLVLRPTENEREHIGRFTALGSLALVDSLKKRGLGAQIKWPNDVLINRKKVAGILTELVWLGTEVDSLVLGMGVNISRASLPPEENLNYPATSIESELGEPVARFDLLRDLLSQLIDLRTVLPTDGFINAWQDALAFRGEHVRLWQGKAQPLEVVVMGLEMDGSLRVLLDNGEMRRINFGEVHLRPTIASTP